MTKFEMKSLGQLKYLLGIEVTRSDRKIIFLQQKYMLHLLTNNGMLTCKQAPTHTEVIHKLGIHPNQVSTDMGCYQRLVNRLICLSYIRPDIAYVVSVVSQFMHAPSEEHIDLLNRILRYLKGAPGKGLMFLKNSFSSIETEIKQLKNLRLDTSLSWKVILLLGKTKGCCKIKCIS